MTASVFPDEFFVSSTEVRNRALNDIVSEELKDIVASVCDKGCQCVACNNTGCNK